MYVFMWFPPSNNRKNKLVVTSLPSFQIGASNGSSPLDQRPILIIVLPAAWLKQKLVFLNFRSEIGRATFSIHPISVLSS